MELSEGKKGRVYAIFRIKKCCPTKLRRRLCDLGFLGGEKVKILSKSLLKKVFLVEIKEYTLSIQRELCKYIILESCVE